MNLRFWTWFRRKPAPAQQRPSEPSLPQEEKREKAFLTRRGVEGVIAAAAPAEGDETVNPFKAAKPAPGVVPEGAQLAMDDALSPDFAYSQQYSAVAEGLVFLGYPLLADMAQRTEYRRPAEIIAREMTRNWLRVISTGDDDKSEKVAAIEAELKRVNAQRAFREAIEQDGLFGRSQIFLDVRAGEEIDDAELQTPLARRPEKIGKGSFRGIRVIEPIWTYPNNYNSTNPLKPNFYKPETWFVLGKQVHTSRLLTFVSREVPDMLKPAYAFGGLSLTQLLRPYVDNWLYTRQSIADLIQMFSTSVLASDLNVLTTPNPDNADIVSRLTMYTRTRTNRGVFLIDKGAEDFKNISTPLGTLDSLQAQAQEHQSSACGIPLIKLFGITPTGLNASSDGEIQTFYESLSAQQEQLSPLVKVLLEVIQLSLFGEIDSEIAHEWNPLKHLDQVQEAAVIKTQAETDAVYIDANVLMPEEVRARLARDEKSPYAGLDLNTLPEPPDDGSENGDDPPQGEGTK